MAKSIKAIEDPEIVAISIVYEALKGLDSGSRYRVLSYVSSKFDIVFNIPQNVHEKVDIPYSQDEAQTFTQTKIDDDFEGISPAGRKWITRSGIRPEKLMSIFSLGIDEIDLVSKSVPGTKKAQRLKNVFLLKGLAAYLGTGSPRFSHEQIKETCLHYDAWDSTNFATILKSMSPDVSGGKEGGYTLTSKGISEATILVKTITGVE